MTLPPVKPEQDPQLAAAWSDASDELPPPPLDSTILAAAHRAVESGPRDAHRPDAARRDARRWRVPLAAAASICVVALGVLLTRPEQPVVSTMSVNAPPSTRVAPAAAPSPPEQVTAPAPALAEAPVRRSEVLQSAAKKRGDDRRELASESVARESADSPVTDKAELFKQSESRVSSNLSGNVAERDAALGAAGAAAPGDAAAAIARIRRLHAEGKIASAAQELRALRLLDPDAERHLPVELRAWAATVKP